MKQGIGQRDSDTVFKRSFSVLVLSVVAARDNAAPYMTAAEFRRLEDAVLAYLAAEQDLRGYDARTGWMHSAEHTADLLKYVKSLLSKLEVLLALEAQPSESIQYAREAVRAALKDLF